MLGSIHGKLLSGVLTAALFGALVGLPSLLGAAAPPPQAPYGKGAVKAPPAKGTLAPGTKLDARGLARHIDLLILAKLKSEKVTPSARTTDEEFLRRVYLDLAGKIPTAEQTKSFLNSTDPQRRAKLIDQLLASKEFGEHQSSLMMNLMLPRLSDNRRLQQFYGNLGSWLATSFNENKPWDKTTKEILTATGSPNTPSPAIYFMANLSVDKITDNVTKVFMGIQLQCAQCHNHPFTDYKQTQYWEMAAFFTKVRVTGNVKQVGKKADPSSVGVSEGPFVFRSKKTLPESAKILSPRFLGGEKAKVAGREPYRPLLANWLATSGNPFFSKAMVNRTWGQLFGRGFVNPVDNMHDGNPPSHPALLVDMAEQFAANGFDVKYLFRAICNSETYQRSSKPTGNNADAPPELFSRVVIRSLSPEQLFDSLTVVLGAPGRGKGAFRKGAGAFRVGAGTPKAAFVAFFNLDESADATEFNAGIPQVLRLMNSPQFNNPGALGTALRSVRDPKEALDTLFLTVLSRKPSAEESTRFQAVLRKYRDDTRRAYGDILWVLLNSPDFQLNR